MRVRPTARAHVPRCIESGRGATPWSALQAATQYPCPNVPLFIMQPACAPDNDEEPAEQQSDCQLGGALQRWRQEPATQRFHPRPPREEARLCLVSAKEVHGIRTALRLAPGTAVAPSRRRVFILVLDAHGLMAEPARSVQYAISMRGKL